MRAFVTGATGFIGGNLVRELIANGIEVRALVRAQSDQRNIEGLSIDLVEGSLEDESLLKLYLQDCQWLFHVAAHYSLFRKDSTSIYQSNVEGTRNIFKAARSANVKKIIHTSSVAAIGITGTETPANESTQTTLENLVSDYKKSKFLAEELAFNAAKDGLPVVIVNPSTPIGPFDIKPTPTGDIILRFLKQQMPFYVHTGLNLIDVRDVAKGHILAAERGKIGERYILGNRNLTLKEMLNILEKITGLAAPLRAIPHWIPILIGYIDELLISRIFNRTPIVPVDSAKMARHPMYYSSQKAVSELGLPQSPIENALEDAVNWFTKNGYLTT